MYSPGVEERLTFAFDVVVEKFADVLAAVCPVEDPATVLHAFDVVAFVTTSVFPGFLAIAVLFV